LENNIREKRIRELKSMRAELMALKEQIESDEGSSEETAAAFASIRKNYSTNFEEINSQKTTINDAKCEVYSQYEGEEQTHEEGQVKKLVRGLRR